MARLIALFSIIPAGFGILSTIIIFFYPLSDKRVDEIVAALAERRKAAGEEVEM